MKIFTSITITLLLTLFADSIYSQKYFQQKVDYSIQVTLHDETHFLSGFETIQYTNNAPHPLNHLYFHLWPNAYKNNHTQLAKEQFRKDGKHYLFNIYEQRGYIDSLNFKVHGKKISWNYHPEHIDICKLQLNKPLKPGETITITTPFRVKIPLAVTSRLGYAEQSYKISHWFPQPAVYNQEGWHTAPYTDRGETYSEYSSFDVSIRLPKNYVVTATGKLLTSAEKKSLQKRIKQTERKLGFNREDLQIPISSDAYKTIRYRADSITTFAWFADKRYHVLADKLHLPRSGKNITIRVFFTNEQADLWRDATTYIKEGLRQYSEWYGPYPYDKFTALMGAMGTKSKGNGYPMGASIGYAATPKQLEQAIIRGIGQSWVSGKVNIDPREYPFLAEGLITFSEKRYLTEKYGTDTKLFPYLHVSQQLARITGVDDLTITDETDLLYQFNARKNLDQSTKTPLKQLTRANYFSVSKAKTTQAFQHLLHYLGKNQFDQRMKRFFRQWKFQHPQPKNLETIFRRHTDNNMDWFFEKLLTTNEKMDYALLRIKGSKLLVKNQGSIDSPFIIKGFKNNQSIYTKWMDGFNGKKWIELPSKPAEKIILDPDHIMPELSRKNNTLYLQKSFKTNEPFNFRLGGLINNPQYTQLNALPSVGWNSYDKFMIGMLTYNPPIPPERFNYLIAPFFSTGTSNLSGQGYVSFSAYPVRFFQQIQLKLSGKRYGYSNYYEDHYNKLQANVRFKFHNDLTRDYGSTALNIQTSYVTDLTDILAQIHNQGEATIGADYYFTTSIIHDYSDKSINPYSIQGDVEWSENFIKATLEANYKLSYYKEEGLSLRLFAGSFLDKTENLPWNYALHLSGGNGWQDYKYERTYLGRFEGPQDVNANQLFVQQFYPEEGAFSTYSPLGSTQDWLVAFNFKTAVPVIDALPIHVYGNAGAFGSSREVPETSIANKTWAYETGIKFSFLNMLDIYFPVLTSPNLKKASNFISSRYGEKIRFHLKFDKLTPQRLREEIKSLY